MKEKINKEIDEVVNPSHYTRLSPQPIEVIEAWGLNYNLGNALSYIARAGFKDSKKEDLHKCSWYVLREAEGKSAVAEEENKQHMSFGDAIEVSEIIDDFVNTGFKDESEKEEVYVTSNGVEIRILELDTKMYKLDIADDKYMYQIIFDKIHIDIWENCFELTTYLKGYESFLSLPVTSGLKGGRRG